MQDVSPVVSDLCDWLRLTLDVRSEESIASKIKALRMKHYEDHSGITKDCLTRTICQVRRELELRHRLTLVNIRGLGYKIATPEELAICTAKWVKRTIMYADRTYRLVDITDRRKIPGAIQKVFGDESSRIKTLSTRGKKFVESFVEYSKKQKLIELKKGGKNGKRT